jgi:serine/threonine-protein kinase
MPQLSRHDMRTLDAPTTAHSDPLVAAGRVELVTGGRSGEQTLQTCSLLGVRLRAAALVMGLACVAFLVKRFLYDSMQGAVDPDLVFGDRLLLWLHAITTTTLLVAAGLLWDCGQGWSITALRRFELAIFGSTTLFFAATQHYITLFTGRTFGYVDTPTGIWCTLVLVYGLFIPNTWRRAALAEGLFCLTPLVVMGIDAAILGRKLISTDEFAVLALLMTVQFVASVYGTHMIGRLRREVFEAREFGQYRLGQRIGTGGMGEVYLAEHQLLKRRSAIKLIRPNRAADPRSLARFEREVRATATLTHPNTVQIFDYGQAEDGTFYYVMEYLPGMSVFELVDRFGPLPPARIIHLLEQTCDALQEAHAIGLLHRDVKPGNIFAAELGGVHDVAKLLDFGLVKAAAGKEANLELTQDGQITGSPLYMSPEQASEKTEPDARSDVYSLGAVAYFMLVGHPPFQAEKPIQVMLAHMQDPIVPPSQLRAGIPADLEQVVLRALAKHPEERYSSAKDLREALLACQAAGSWTRDDAERWWQERADQVPSAGQLEPESAPLETH